MSAPSKRYLIGAWLLGFVSLSPELCQGYTLVDWMRMWPRYSPTPVAAAPGYLPSPPVISPGTPMAPPASGAACGTPTAATGTMPPTVAYAPVAPANPFCTWCQRLFPQAGSSGPQVRYRTSWVQVPTTNYRAVSSRDPLTGAVTTTMRPCTTYTWQMQRVPESLRPGLFPVASPNSPPSGCAVAGYTTAVGTGVPGACPTCPAPMAAPALPYYAPAPAPASPVAPGLSSPYANQPNAAAPYPSPTPAGPPAPRSPNAADQKPSLSPGDRENMPLNTIPRATTNYPPTNTERSLIPPATPGASPSKAAPALRPGSEITPLPDPDARPSSKVIPAAPTLFDTRERTAQRTSQATPAAIAESPMPEPRAALIGPMLNEPVPPPQKAASKAAGWRAVNP